MKMLRRIPKSITFLFWMTIVTGVAYPLFITGVAQLAFPDKANGSLLAIGGQVRGSRLLAQKFATDRFFRARPSASDYVYVGAGASNMSATNSALAKAVKDSGDAWAKAYGGAAPAEMLYASGSGLDPDISLESALAQLEVVAAARGFGTDRKAALADAIRKAAAEKTSLLGPPRVNVVELNARLETDPAFGAAK